MAYEDDDLINVLGKGKNRKALEKLRSKLKEQEAGTKKLVSRPGSPVQDDLYKKKVNFQKVGEAYSKDFTMPYDGPKDVVTSKSKSLGNVTRKKYDLVKGGKAAQDFIEVTPTSVKNFPIRTPLKTLGKALKGAGIAGEILFPNEVGSVQDDALMITENQFAKDKNLARLNSLGGNIASLMGGGNIPNMSDASPEQLKQIASMNKPMVEEQVINSPQLKEGEKKKIIRNVNSSSKMDQLANQQASGEQPKSLEDKFTSALAFFSPQIIGGLIGGLFEGTEGAIGGIEASGQLRDDYNKLKESEAKLAMDARKMEQEVVAENRRERALDLENRKLLSRDTNQGFNREFKGIDLAKNIAEADRRRLLASSFTPKQQADYFGRQSVIEQIGDLQQILSVSDPVTGQITGRYNDLAAMASSAPDEYIKVRTRLNNILSDYQRSKSGLTVTEGERQKLMETIGSTTSSPQEIEIAVKEFAKLIRKDQELSLNSIIKMDPMKAPVATRLLQEMGVAAVAPTMTSVGFPAQQLMEAAAPSMPTQQPVVEQPVKSLEAVKSSPQFIEELRKRGLRK